MLDIQKHASVAAGAALAGRNLQTVLADIWRRYPKLDSHQRGAIQDIAYGVARHGGLLHALLNGLASKPIKEDALSNLMLVALYQLQFTRAAPHAVVDFAVQSVERARLIHAKGFVNAALRNFLRERDARVQQAQNSSDEARFSYPQWWIDKINIQYNRLVTNILETGNQHPPMTLRVNRRKISVAGYLDKLQIENIPATQTGPDAITLTQALSLEKLPGFHGGQVSLQDASAQFAAPLLDLHGGQRVLDASAAPGGKAAHILELADVQLLALDEDEARLKQVSENFARLELQGEAKCADAGDVKTWWDGKPFDRVLIDAPCSGSGVVKRHPDIKWARRASDLPGFARQQARLLDALWQCLAQGGKLLYVTCSVFREENQDQAQQFLTRHPDAASLPLNLPLTINGQILPDDNHDGFYYSLLQKS
ncbi:MAG: 16S rRNA (cytosine(967)-C(5))-methyltransferase RsmB [Burkholderiales bacterium]